MRDNYRQCGKEAQSIQIGKVNFSGTAHFVAKVDKSS
jgi:hypothetical protein